MTRGVRDDGPLILISRPGLLQAPTSRIQISSCQITAEWGRKGHANPDRVEFLACPLCRSHSVIVLMRHPSAAIFGILESYMSDFKLQDRSFTVQYSTIIGFFLLASGAGPSSFFSVGL
jgi:hypothetical protein